MTDGNSTFIKVTNKDIYKKLLDIEQKVSVTNGKVKLNRWVATTALTLAITIVFFLLGVKV